MAGCLFTTASDQRGVLAIEDFEPGCKRPAIGWNFALVGGRPRWGIITGYCRANRPESLLHRLSYRKLQLIANLQLQAGHDVLLSLWKTNQRHGQSRRHHRDRISLGPARFGSTTCRLLRPIAVAVSSGDRVGRLDDRQPWCPQTAPRSHRRPEQVELGLGTDSADVAAATRPAPRSQAAAA